MKQVLEGVESRGEELMIVKSVLDGAGEVKRFSSKLVCLREMIAYTT